MTTIFEPLECRRLTLPTRILRAATYENMADPDGRVGERHAALYEGLARGGAEDRPHAITPELTAAYIREIEPLEIVDAIEISYGTMEIAFNIIRGGHPLDPVLRYNHLFTRFGAFFCQVFRHLVFPWYKRRFLPYSPKYNLENALAIKKRARSAIPLLVTGGIRTAGQIREIVEDRGLDGVTLCRPFIREPEIVAKFRSDPRAVSLCTNCNLCTVHCDSPFPLRCFAVPQGKSG